MLFDLELVLTITQTRKTKRFSKTDNNADKLRYKYTKNATGATNTLSLWETVWTEA